MAFYELVYEDGSYGVASYEDDAEALRAAKEAHRRATQGEPAVEPAPGEPTMRAVRVVKVLKYGDTHPNEFNAEQVASADEVLARVKETLKAMGDTVSLHEVAADIRAMSEPLAVREHPHDSGFKMKEAGALKGWDK